MQLFCWSYVAVYFETPTLDKLHHFVVFANDEPAIKMEVHKQYTSRWINSIFVMLFWGIFFALNW